MPELYRADDDATPLDVQVMALAQWLHETGWMEEAEQVAGHMAVLRETPRHAEDVERLSDLHDALVAMRSRPGASPM